MQHDRWGLEVTTCSTASVEPLNEAVRSLLGHRADVGAHLARALAADGGMVVALCLAGFGRLLLARGDLVGEARRYAEAARRSLAERGGTPREHRLVRALAAGCDGGMETSVGLLERSLAAEPLDPMTFKLAHAIRFMLGDSVGMRLAAEAVLPAWTPGTPERGFILGCHAFALEEQGDFAHAERIGREAVALAPDDAWGCHAVAHVLHATRRVHEGLRWLERREPSFAATGPFAAHLSWHRALLHLTQAEVDAALDIYDMRVRPSAGADYRGFANAASLLWRLERAGAAIGDRWDELADLVRECASDHALVFASLHHMLAFAGARRREAAIAMLGSMDVHAREGSGTQARLLREIGISMAKAIFAASTGENRRAAELLMESRKDWRRLGGSEVQRSIFGSLLSDVAHAAAGEEQRHSSERNSAPSVAAATVNSRAA